MFTSRQVVSHCHSRIRTRPLYCKGISAAVLHSYEIVVYIQYNSDDGPVHRYLSALQRRTTCKEMTVLAMVGRGEGGGGGMLTRDLCAVIVLTRRVSKGHE